MDKTTNENSDDLGGEEGTEEQDIGEESDPTHDSFGYAIEKDDKEESSEDKDEDGEDEEESEDEEEEKPKKKKDDKKKVTGYEEPTQEELDAQEAAAKKKKEEADKNKTPEQLSEEEKLDKELTETLKDLPEGWDANKIKTFAKENKLTPVQVKAYKEMVKAEAAEAVKENEEFVKEQRAGWLKELKEDKEFGGANFLKNVDRVEKLLENNMPNVKKVLTEKGGMLPPYFMRDLLALDKKLNPKSKFVGGNPPAPKKEANNFLEEMYK